MVLFPHAKINLGLRVLRKRSDGFHELHTLFYPVVAVRDALEMLPASQTTLHISGVPVPGDPEANLCLKAHELLQLDYSAVKPVSIYLHKQIPIGAGLGGGSSDGAFALRLLNRLFKLELSTEQLLPYAAQLGSDCPFFLYDGPCLASGRGEMLTPLSLDLSDYKIILVNPGIHVNTGWAFKELDRSETAHYAALEHALPPISEWRQAMHNDFEPVVFKAFPEVSSIKDQLYERGAVYAAMSGSGSTVYGLFPKLASPHFNFPSHYWTNIPGGSR
jgi:4-diphosphocytidyl-2-C-methyl-D-erythritol kinase